MSLRSPYDLRGDRTDLVLHVRPIKDTGVLFYTDSQSSSDFLGLALNDGYLVYRLVLPWFTSMFLAKRAYSTAHHTFQHCKAPYHTALQCNTISYHSMPYFTLNPFAVISK
jgi:hypothetical protein